LLIRKNPCLIRVNPCPIIFGLCRKQHVAVFLAYFMGFARGSFDI
jgi:hypothetical protein